MAKIARNICNWSALDSAVVEQLGFDAPTIEGDSVTLSEEAAGTLEDVTRCSCGAAGGFGNFIYYSDTWVFFRAHRDAIRAALQELAEDLCEGCAVDLVRGFGCFSGERPSADDVRRILWGELPERWESAEDVDPFAIANACAFFALEECAHKWND